MSSRPVRCRWRRSGSLPEAKDVCVRQGTAIPERQAWTRTSTLPERTRRVSVEGLNYHVQDAQSLEQLHRLSMMPNERVVVPVATEQGTSFHIYNSAEKDQAFLRYSEQLFLQLSRGPISMQAAPSQASSEVEF
ncbi:unnamed protein product [Aphanomyces euteiches]|uniref:Uncharacterized protein n=1 Tax=Aphanomyces euteiches TaxID=100861 RepID=A0A6G0WUI4_9STRA|nr:hypothetical protein Ae201684_011430 [Aphanomyces euteiches]KAH9097099.1 hypothetical protein Ae201684P_011828 [Aphanomyces euteiches]KAH9104020.1 hypothetical protein AeMF1_019796 [Aphanomyces euteiches]KAH9135035.1 hypothetical protein LEN26_006605 [Aphanomyces euteiches]KAH9152104.1 hypothetical protein AeRB84_005416 [Aphanomyces euteiches]